MGAAGPDKIRRSDFFWDYSDEPHASRRKEIMAKYPEVKKLMGHCPATKFKVLFVVITQIWMAYIVHDKPWPIVVAAAWVYSGTVNHMMSLAIHEISHNLAFKKAFPNKVLGFIANLPMGIPASVSFRRYHLEHHRYQGEDEIDVDIPTVAEGKFFTTTFLKFIFVLLQPAFYALRPLFVQPKKPGIGEMLNFAVVLSFDGLIYYMWGGKALFYLVGGTLLGMGFHPVAGHFIAEHYVFIKRQETYSYYGPLNWFAFNVGYHNEHHDFPFVAGSRLPELRKIAPEYYDDLPHYQSWMKVILEYIFDPTVGPFSRVKRNILSEADVKKIRES